MVEKKAFVDGALFLGRSDEQGRYRQALDRVLKSDPAAELPVVFLLKGEEGIGKSTLLRRLRDIAAKDPEYETTVQTMLVDWERERFRSTALQVPDDETEASTVLDHLYQAARDVGWGHHFSEYQKVVRTLDQATKKVAEAIEHECWGSRFRALRGLDIVEFSILVQELPVNGSLPERALPDTVSLIVREGPELLAEAKQQADEWLEQSAQLEANELSIYRAPLDHLARGLGAGFAKIAQSKALVLLLDSYELVDQADTTVRQVMRAAGGRVVWVLARRTAPSEGSTDPWLSRYREEFDQQLIALKVKNLTRLDVAQFMQARAPDRLLTPEDGEAIAEATRGVPLAVREASDLWAGGLGLKEITAGASEKAVVRDVIARMSELLLLHCDDPEDRQALILFAIQRRPDPDVQTEVLRLKKGPFELEDYLRRFVVRYSSVRFDRSASMHEAAALSIRRYLLRRRIRMSDEVKVVTAKATTAINKIRERIEAGIPRLEDRFANEEWREVLIDSIYWMFWHNEFNAWRHFTRNLVDAMGYDPKLAKSLIAIAEGSRALLSKAGQQRFRVLKAGIRAHYSIPSQQAIQTGALIETEEAMFAELETWLTRYGGKDVHAMERRAILDLCRGEMYYRNERYAEALKLFNQSERNVPQHSEALAAQLARAFERLGDLLGWRKRVQDGMEAIPSRDAEIALKKSLTLGRRRAMTYHTLGAIQDRMGKLEAALENLLQAVTLNPGTDSVWQHLGDVYRKQERCEKAVPAYRRAIELSRRPVSVRLSLADCYAILGKTEEFEQEIQKIAAEIEGESEYIRARYEAVRGNIDQALELVDAALKQNQITRAHLLEEPSFASARSDSRFQELLKP